MSSVPAFVTPSPSPERLSGPARAVRHLQHLARVLRAVVDATVNRRDVTRMLDLDDRMLKDIGLTRNDVLGALGSRLAQDPSVLLRRRSVESRARQRAFEVETARRWMNTGSARG